MNNPAQILDLLKQIPEMEEAVLLCELAGGPVSHSWLIRKRDQKMVLRKDTHRVGLIGLDRTAELEVLKQVAKAGIGPNLVWANIEKGLLITEFIEGESWSEKDARNADKLRGLARLLRTVHALPVETSTFQPGAAANRYAEAIGTSSAYALARKVNDVTESLIPGDEKLSLCHNDLIHKNIIEGQQIRLIDWEYAAMGHPLFDLAVVICHHELDRKSADGFLYEYLGKNDPQAREKLDDFCDLYQWLSSLWYELMRK